MTRLRSRLGRLYRRVTHRPKSRRQIHSYWRSPPTENAPERYAWESRGERSRFLVSLVERYASSDARILEVGCNVGRNLEYLRRAGFMNLTGIDINPQAVALMGQTYPELADLATIKVGAAEDIIPSFGDSEFDVVFTLAVLEHIHPESEWLFAHLARIARTLITIEDERTVHWRVFPRNYREVFEGLGRTQVHEEICGHLTTLGSMFVARVFR